jgi:hypothetical protein
MTEKALSSIGIRLRVAKPAASITFLCNDRPSAFTRVEAAAAGCAVGIAGAGTGDELGALADNQQGHWWDTLVSGRRQGWRDDETVLTIEQNKSKQKGVLNAVGHPFWQRLA